MSKRNTSPKRATSTDRVTVAWLDPGTVTSDFCNSICDLFHGRADVMTGRITIRSGGAIVRGRNRSVNEFLTGSNDDWLLLVDSDMSFPVEAFSKVLAAADPVHAPVVGGLCFAHDGYHLGPFATLLPTIMVARGDGGYAPVYDYPDDAMVEVDATGAAFLLVHRTVLLAVQEMVGLRRWSWFTERPVPEVDDWLGEDMAFCELVKRAGFPIFVHTGAKIGHVKGLDYVLTEEMYRLLRPAPGA
jgi:hypothetical protein